LASGLWAWIGDDGSNAAAAAEDDTADGNNSKGGGRGGGDISDDDDEEEEACVVAAMVLRICTCELSTIAVASLSSRMPFAISATLEPCSSSCALIFSSSERVLASSLFSSSDNASAVTSALPLPPPLLSPLPPPLPLRSSLAATTQLPLLTLLSLPLPPPPPVTTAGGSNIGGGSGYVRPSDSDGGECWGSRGGVIGLAPIINPLPPPPPLGVLPLGCFGAARSR